MKAAKVVLLAVVIVAVTFMVIKLANHDGDNQAANDKETESVSTNPSDDEQNNDRSNNESNGQTSNSGYDNETGDGDLEDNGQSNAGGGQSSNPGNEGQLPGSGSVGQPPSNGNDQPPSSGNGQQPNSGNEGQAPDPGKSGQAPGSGSGNGSTGSAGSPDAVVTVAKPADIAVLVNKMRRLPPGYTPDDLVYPDVPFTFSEKSDKRKLRKEAAEALELMFKGALEDKIKLAGVSGYRSESRQKTLFNNYVNKDGEEAANKYSARPGFSEHQTGLAIDVSGADGKCQAEPCFADTPEAKWLADHAAEYGFIIRYPDGMDDITGYQYEPWHLRYVGITIAQQIYQDGNTLEQYYDAVEVDADQ